MSDAKPPITENHLDFLEAEAGVPFEPRLRAFLLDPTGILMQEDACLDIDDEVHLFGLLWPPNNPHHWCMFLHTDTNGDQIVSLFENGSQYTIGALVGEQYIGPDLVVCAIDEEEGLRMLEYTDIDDMIAAATANIPYNDGQRAHEAGQLKDTNPHAVGTPKFQMWNDAWDARDEEETFIAKHLPTASQG